MSVHINGFLFAPKIIAGPSLGGDRPLLEKALMGFRLLQRELKPMAEEIHAKAVAQFFTEVIDSVHLGNKLSSDPINEAIQHVIGLQTLARERHVRQPEVDVEFQICAIPVGERVFCIHYVEQDSFLHVLRERTWFQEYVFWDSSDKPALVSEKEWRRRRDEWRSILNNRPPSEAGFTFQVVDSERVRVPSLFSIEANLPSKEKRARALAREFAWASFCAEEGISGHGPEEANWVAAAERFREEYLSENGALNGVFLRMVDEWKSKVADLESYFKKGRIQ